MTSQPEGQVDPVGPPARGIFLHTGWRSAGTWVWSRLRALDHVTAFYEPFSALLGDLKLADINVIQPAMTSGHPALKKPYYDEYRPFLQPDARGVTGYRKRFSIDRFAPVPNDEFPPQHAYLRQLCGHALDAHKVPVLKFCRTSGRLPWLAAAFPDAMHVGVMRNPVSQFMSGWQLHQQWSNPFFVAAPFRVLGIDQREPDVRRAIDACGVRLPPEPMTTVDEYAAACERYARTVEGGHAYRAFVALWALAATRMTGGIDLTVDMDRIGQSADYAATLRAAFRDQAGVAPDFSGARNLVDETKRSASRVKGIDGATMRSVHAAARQFIAAHADAHRMPADIATLIAGKLALADELSALWR